MSRPSTSRPRSNASPQTSHKCYTNTGKSSFGVSIIQVANGTVTIPRGQKNTTLQVSCGNIVVDDCDSDSITVESEVRGSKPVLSCRVCRCVDEDDAGDYLGKTNDPSDKEPVVEEDDKKVKITGPGFVEIDGKERDFEITEQADVVVNGSCGNVSLKKSSSLMVKGSCLKLEVRECSMANVTGSCQKLVVSGPGDATIRGPEDM